MLKFRLLIIAFLIAIIFPFAFVKQISAFYFIGIILLFSAVLYYGVAFINSGFFIKTICHGSTGKKQIALSFDDGPSPDYTSKILSILRNHKVEAAFFCIGKNCVLHPSILSEIDAQGHIIGNHTYSHSPWTGFYTASRLRNEISRTSQAIFSVTGKNIRFFRQPYGITTPSLSKVIRTFTMQTIGWNIRSFDTIANNPEALKAKIVSSLKEDAIILLHDTRQITFEILDSLLHEIKARGYEIVRLDKLIQLEAYD